MRRVFLVLAIAFGGVGIATAVALGADGSETQVVEAASETAIEATVAPLAETPGTHRDLAHLPVPKDVIPVADHEGKLVGYVESTAEFSALQLGGRTTRLRGVNVVDDRGDVVGYDVIALGFVDLVEAEDPDALERRLAESEAVTKEFLENEPPATVPGR